MSPSWKRLPSLRGAMAAAVLGASLVAVAAPGAGAATLPTLNVSLGKGSITVSGSTVSGGVDVVVSTAKGLKEPGALLLQLRPGVTVAELEAVLARKKAKDPNNADPYGTIVFDAEGVPGAAVEAQTQLTAGTWVALETEGEGGPKAKAVFTVTASSSPAALPAPAAVERTIDFGFRGPTTLHDGELVRFENEGWLVHMDIAFPVKSRTLALRAAHDLLVGREKAVERLIAGPPVAFYGPLSHGGFQQETIAAKPGWYVQVCFMDTQDGRSHNLLGMERVIHIVK